MEYAKEKANFETVDFDISRRTKAEGACEVRLELEGDVQAVYMRCT